MVCPVSCFTIETCPWCILPVVQHYCNMWDNRWTDGHYGHLSLLFCLVLSSDFCFLSFTLLLPATLLCITLSSWVCLQVKFSVQSLSAVVALGACTSSLSFAVFKKSSGSSITHNALFNWTTGNRLCERLMRAAVFCATQLSAAIFTFTAIFWY